MVTAIDVFGASDALVTPATALSIGALLFTLGSFWWIQVRRGRIHGYTGFTLSAAIGPAQTIFYMPVVFHNPAAASLVVSDLRMVLEAGPNPDEADRAVLPAQLFWVATHDAVYPESGKHRQYAMPFPVEGRKSLAKVIEFQWEGRKSGLLSGPYVANIDARVVPRKRRLPKWERVLSMPLNTQLWEERGRGVISPRSNDPDYHAAVDDSERFRNS